jgi:hypothetical protein
LSLLFEEEVDESLVASLDGCCWSFVVLGCLSLFVSVSSRFEAEHIVVCVCVCVCTRINKRCSVKTESM